MSKLFNLYLGKGGEFSVVSEFLARGWNVALPQVDVGDDLFVVEDRKGLFHRIQVKTAQASSRKNGYTAQFAVLLPQLLNPIEPEIYFVFTTRLNDVWQDKVIIKREALSRYYEDFNIGTAVGNSLILYFAFSQKGIFCSKIDLTSHLNDYSDFPTLSHTNV
jgi:hypothetical protein